MTRLPWLGYFRQVDPENESVPVSFSKRITDSLISGVFAFFGGPIPVASVKLGKSAECNLQPSDSVRTLKLSDDPELRVQRGALSSSTLWWALFLAPAAIYIGLCFWFVVNAPYWDDFDAILAFANRTTTQSSWSTLGDLFQFHNQHRIATTRFFVWVNLLACGEVSFLGLIAIGNLLLALLTVVLVLEARRVGINGYWLIPIPALLLSFTYVDNSLVAMQAIQNLGVHAFAGFAFFCWPRQRIIAIIFGAIAAVTSAGGLLVLPILAGFDFFVTWRASDRSISESLRRWLRGGGIWLVIASIVVWSLYLINFPSLTGRDSPVDAIKRPYAFLKFFVKLAGIPVWIGFLRTICGICELLILNYAVRRIDWRRNSFFLQFVVFELGTIGLICLLRMGHGSGAANSYRFNIVPLLLATTIYCLFVPVVTHNLSIAKKESAGWIAAVSSLCLNLVLAVCFLNRDCELQLLMAKQLSTDPATCQEFCFPVQEYARQQVVESLQKGILRWPTPASHQVLQTSQVTNIQR